MINITFQYKPLFSVNLEHAFFSESHFDGYSIVPTADCISLLQQNNFLLKRTTEGFDILYDLDFPEKTIKKIELLKGKQQKFSFLLFVKDSFFKNYTEIPYDTNNKVFYFTNRALKDKTEGILHKSEVVTGSDLVEFNTLSIEDNVTYNIKKSGFIGEDIPTHELSKKDAINTFFDGAYEVLQGKDTVAEFVKCSDKIVGQPLGMIDIELNDKILEEIEEALLSDDRISFLYKICFEARAIKWRYTLVPVNIKKTTGLKIVAQKKDSKIKFQEVKTKEETNDHKIFESKDEIKFQEFYAESFQLKKGDSGADSKTIKKKLPYPALDFIKPLGKDKYFSDIIIYI